MPTLAEQWFQQGFQLGLEQAGAIYETPCRIMEILDIRFGYPPIWKQLPTGRFWTSFFAKRSLQKPPLLSTNFLLILRHRMQPLLATYHLTQETQFHDNHQWAVEAPSHLCQ